MYKVSKYSALVFLLATPLFLSAQQSQTTSVVSPRPVRAVISEWEKQYGWVITYEDPVFEYADDLEDVTLKVRRDIKPGEPIDPDKRIIGSKERRLVVTYMLPNNTDDPATQFEATKHLADAYSQIAGNTFRLSQSADRIHVIPGLVRDKGGELRGVHPILDTLITIPAGDRTGEEFLSTLCDELTAMTGQSVIEGIIPVNILAQFHTKAGYENLPARQILEEFLNTLPNGQRYTWALLFQKNYALNIHWVRSLNPIPSREKSYPSPPQTTAVQRSVDNRTTTVRR